MKEYTLFTALKKGNIVWKWRGYNDYSSIWIFYLRAVLDILGGLISLFIVPFGYECNFQMAMNEWQIRRTFRIMRKNKEKEN